MSTVPHPNPKSSGNEAHEAFTNRTPTRPTVEACSSWKASTTALLTAKLPLVTTLHQVSRSRLGRSLQSWPMGGASNLVEQSGAFGRTALRSYWPGANAKYVVTFGEGS